MGLLDEIIVKVNDVGQKGVQKAKDVSDIARLNSLITQDENKINDLYCQIGKLYVDTYGNDCEEKFSSLVSMVTDLEKEIKEYKNQIEEVKNVQRCEKCGAEVTKGASYCTACGHMLVKPETKPAAFDYKKCSKCGERLEEGMNFCTRCGTPVVRDEVNPGCDIESTGEIVVPDVLIPEEPPKRRCPNCGAEQEDDANFCTECATKL